MLGWCIVIFASARLKASMQFPPLRRMYQKKVFATTATAAVSLKGEFTDTFPILWDLRQSCLLSLYLFVLIGEALHAMSRAAI